MRCQATAQVNSPLLGHETIDEAVFCLCRPRRAAMEQGSYATRF
jgi:hypothetical protein